jgi:hypothetical protein
VASLINIRRTARSGRSERLGGGRQEPLIGGGACWNDLAADLGRRARDARQAFGDSGVAGLTITGGIGCLAGVYGCTLYNLVAATLVAVGR